MFLSFKIYKESLRICFWEIQKYFNLKIWSLLTIFYRRWTFFFWLRLFENNVNNSKKKLFFVLIFSFNEKNLFFFDCLNVVIFFQNFSIIFLTADLSIIHFDEYPDNFLKDVFVFLFFVDFFDFLFTMIIVFNICKIFDFKIFKTQKCFEI